MSNTTRQGGSDAPAAIPIEASRRGAHRARPNPWFGVLPALAVAAVAVAVAVLTYTLFGNHGSSSVPSAAATVTPTGAATPGASAVAPGPTATATAGAPVDPSPASSVTPGTGASPQPSATGGIDPNVTLRFFNGTRPNVQGVSRVASEKFTALGWKVGPYAVWAGPAVTQTTIYYGKAEQKATAQTIVATLGAGAVKLSPARAGKGIVIVVSNDYKA